MDYIKKNYTANLSVVEKCGGLLVLARFQH